MTNSWNQVWKLRKSLYGFFANCLLEPIKGEYTVAFTQRFWREFPMEAANLQMKAGLEQLIKYSSYLESLSNEMAVEQVMVEYTGLFLGPGQPKALPCESFYRTEERVFFGSTSFQIKAMLHEKGLESKKKFRQPDDHIGLELLFLSVLSDRMLVLGSSEQVNSIEEQLTFIEQHLLSWVHEFCQDVKQYGSVGFYGGFIELICGVLQWDRELMEEFVVSYEQAIPTLN